MSFLRIILISATYTVLSLHLGCSTDEGEENSETTQSPAVTPSTAGGGSSSGACFHIRSGDEVTQGSEAESEYEAVGKITVRSRLGSLMCTGTLIKPNVVLTAKHCVETSGGQTFPASSFAFKLNNGTRATSVSKVIPWDQSTHRDVALLVLKSNYAETIPYYQVESQKLDWDNGTELTAVGFGGYTDGQDIGSYSDGIKRIGQMRYSGYRDNGYFGDVVDNVYLLPGSEKEQMICPGDSGSSLFSKTGGTNTIVGVASLGATNRRVYHYTQQCHYGAAAYYVPAYSFKSWVDDKLKNVGKGSDSVGEGDDKSRDDRDKNGSASSEALISGTIQDLIKNDGYDTIAIADSRTGSIRRVDVCYSDCTSTIVNVKLDVNKQVNILYENKQGRLLARKVYKPNTPYQYDVKFIATIKKAPYNLVKSSKLNSSEIDFHSVEDNNLSIPLTNLTAKATLCRQGCKLLAVTSGSLTKGNKVKVKATVIDNESIYLREVRDINSQCSG